MNPLTLAEIAEICSGTVEERFAPVRVRGVSTDSRTVQPEDLFIALGGERHDGHDHVTEALTAGAAAALISRRAAEEADQPVVVVGDTLRAFGALAAHHRSSLATTIAAVTGSSGKTTTKNLAGAVLQQVGPTLVAPGTENNEIGVPRALLALEESHRFSVLEMAMRGSGEISYLARMARPQIGVITNIGEAHIGRLGSRERLAQAKAELLAELPADGVAVLNADDFFFGLLSEIAPCRVVAFGMNPPAEITAADLVARGVEGCDFTLKTPGGAVRIALGLPGAHNVANALAAAGVGLAAGATLEQIKAGLESAKPDKMRGEAQRSAGGFTVINDCYNANPHSMAAALAMLGAIPGRKLAVLGDMLELGEEAEAAHRRLGELVADQGIDRLVTVGPLAALMAEEAASRGVRCEAVQEPGAAVALLRPELRPGDTVLVKASRALALESVVEGLLHDD